MKKNNSFSGSLWIIKKMKNCLPMTEPWQTFVEWRKKSRIAEPYSGIVKPYGGITKPFNRTTKSWAVKKKEGWKIE